MSESIMLPCTIVALIAVGFLMRLIFYKYQEISYPDVDPSNLEYTKVHEYYVDLNIFTMFKRERPVVVYQLILGVIIIPVTIIYYILYLFYRCVLFMGKILTKEITKSNKNNKGV